jgi:hypothetical protein
LITEKLVQSLIARSVGAKLQSAMTHDAHIVARLDRLQEENLQLQAQLQEMKQKLQVYQ